MARGKFIAGLLCLALGAAPLAAQSISGNPPLAGAGTVTSVGISPPSIFTAGAPVTASGSVSFGLASQTANQVWIAPNGASGAPTFRGLVTADLPAQLNGRGSGSGPNSALFASDPATPAIGFAASGAATDQKYWDMQASTSAISLRAINDAVSAANPIFTATRSGASPTGFNIYAPLTLSSPLAVASGGIGTSAAGGQALDNVTGFAGTGLIRRTGTAAYSLGTGVLNSELASAPGATVKANVSGSATTPTDVSFASFNIAMGSRCANILLYGGDPTDTNDNSAAFAAARASIPLCVYFPQGIYKFTASINIALAATPAAQSFMMYGDGPDISVLDFQGNISGFGITLGAVQQSFHVRNMTFATGCTTTGCSAITGVLSPTTVSDPASNAASDVTGVSLRGRDGIAQTDAWDIGLNLNKVSNVSLVNSSIFGNSTISPSDGVIVYGTSTAIPVVLNIVNSIIDRNALAVNLGSYFQGLQVTNSNMTGNARGIYVAASTPGINEVAINNSQFNNSISDIELNSIVTDLIVSGNDIYVQGAGTGIGLNGSVGSYTISGNSFSGLTTTNTNAIQIGAYGSRSGIISGNVFWGLTTAVLLQSTSQRANVQSNSYNTVTNTVLNSGTNNIVGGGSQ